MTTPTLMSGKLSSWVPVLPEHFSFLTHCSSRQDGDFFWIVILILCLSRL